MKIIANSGGHSPSYIVEVSEGDLAMMAGFGGSYDDQWRKLRDRTGVLPAGTKIPFRANMERIQSLASHEAKAKDAADTLRALAGLLDKALPAVSLPPAPALVNPVAVDQAAKEPPQ